VTREHAILAKRIINHDAGGVPIICCWDTCDRPATSLYVTRQHEHLRNVSCEGVDLGVELGRHITFAFCTYRHKAYWDNATGANAHESIARTGRAYGNLPVGVRGRDQIG
jgi:hypothetical protein